MIFPLILATSVLIADDRQTITSIGLTLPNGFEVSLYAGPALAPDIQAITMHPAGGVIASGPGYVRLLQDRNQDGQADHATEMLSPFAAGAMGLFAEESDLYVTDSHQLLHYVDHDGDRKMDGEPTILFRAAGSGEHALHGIRRGPDGWLYFIAGDGSGLLPEQVTSRSSPVANPVGGCLVRLSPDGQRVEIVADGFRNPYDFDFNTVGDIFTYDSDNERCVGLPWYEPTRVYHVEVGGHHGWLGGKDKNIYRLPPYFPDVTPPAATLGRGSPTGVAVYHHHQFPEHYHGGLFVLDWTFGKVHYLPLVPNGASYQTEPEMFLESIGGQGFAPTDIEIDPRTGDLFIAVGGRGTRGEIYRIRYPAGFPPKQGPDQPTPVDLDNADPFRSALVRAASPTSAAGQRRSFEIACRFPTSFDPATLRLSIKQGLASRDPFLARAAARLTRRSATAGLSLESSDIPAPEELIWHLLAGGEQTKWADLWDDIDPNTLSRHDQLAYLRGAQILSGDVGDPSRSAAVDYLYRPRSRNASFRVPTAIWGMFPTSDARVDREIARLAGIIEWNDPAWVRRFVEILSHEQDPIQKVHYLIVLSRLPLPPDSIDLSTVADVLLTLMEQYRAAGIRLDTNGPPRLREIHALLAHRHPLLNAALLKSKHFGSEGTLLWCQAPGFDRRQAAHLLVSELREGKERIEWDADLVNLLAELPSEQAKELVRRHVAVRSLQPAISRILAHQPALQDVDALLSMVRASDEATSDRVLNAIERLSPAPSRSMTTSLARQVVLSASTSPSRIKLLTLLSKWRSKGDPVDVESCRAWLKINDAEWFQANFSASTWDPARWRNRLQQIDPARGQPARGKSIYEKLSCAGCHEGARAIGPDLAGITKRFSREDLYAAIVDPDRDISDRYRGTRFVTLNGNVFEGVIAYEAVDGALIQQANLETVRLRPAEIESRQPLRRSMMPRGLLDQSTDQDLADLENYLRQR
ncbi:c-type cytochrome [bacterium]|nr:c-type cytochrome [bacterium]